MPATGIDHRSGEVCHAEIVLDRLEAHTESFALVEPLIHFLEKPAHDCGVAFSLEHMVQILGGVREEPDDSTDAHTKIARPSNGPEMGEQLADKDFPRFLTKIGIRFIPRGLVPDSYEELEAGGTMLREEFRNFVEHASGEFRRERRI